ncbi:MAG: radical SAM protein [Firmicutes bacterium]|nr:radical SAM protein [Bacillota bacterium]
MKVKTIQAKSFMTKTNIGGSDFTCNPFIGCQHGCIYCYAKYMLNGRDTNEIWGSFVEVKQYLNHNIPKGTGSKNLIFSSATDPYQPIEKNVESVKHILEDIVESDLKVSILTKSGLIVRDIDLLSKMKNVEVGFSIALNDELAKQIEPGASLPSVRIEALKALKERGIKTYVFIAPIIPILTNVFQIIDSTKDFVDYYMFDSLNLKHPDNQKNIFQFINQYFPDLLKDYQDIFIHRNSPYYNSLRDGIIDYVNKNNIQIRYIYDRKEERRW